MKALLTAFCLLASLAFLSDNFNRDGSTSQAPAINGKPALHCPEPPSFAGLMSGDKSKGAPGEDINPDWYSQALERIEAEEYNITYSEELGAYQSPNRANNMRFIYHRNGFTARGKSGDWSAEFETVNKESGMNGEVMHAAGNTAWIENDIMRTDYVNDRNGMRQNFVIRQKPQTAGRLRVVMSVKTDLKMIAGADALMFKDKHGSLKLKYSSLKCWDAEGKELRAYFEKIHASPKTASLPGFSIVVNDKDAAYPVTIDPLSTSPDWSAESDQAFADFGVWVSTAGDVNGDGYSDVIIGANLYDNGQADEGRAYLYYGSGTGLSLSPNWVNEGNQEYCNYGIGVGTAGDVNGDGYSDVIVGADLYDNGQTNEGRAYVYYGSSTGLSMTPNWTAENNQAESIFGYRVATAGDINGDGYSDVLINSVGYDNGETNEGRVYAYLGSATGLSANPAWTAESNQSDSEFGISLSSAGDVNGDGYSDVLVGANSYDNGETSEGKIFVYQGSSSGLPASPSWTFESNMANAYLGWRASSAGDVNGDGYSDITAGAPFYNGYGRVYTFYGSALGLPATADWIVDSDQSESAFGGAVSNAGDVNGDGYSDVMIGACLYDNPENKEGRAFLYQGSPSGLSSSPSWMIESNQAGAEFGVSVSTAGDVNGDGYSDVVVGSFYYDGGQVHEGKAFVYHGSPSGLSVPVSWAMDGYQSGSQLGISVSTAGDVNGDGYSDVIIGANTYDNGETDEGRAYVFLGSATGLSASPSWFSESNQAYAYFGFRVSSAGDVNGDGFSDVMVTAIRFDDGETDEGKVFLYYGSSSGLSAIPDWTAQCNNQNALFGYQLKSAGDVNGDGYSDVIIGAADYSNGENYEGKAFLYYGSPSGLSLHPNWVYEINQSMAHLGNSVSSADDVNGDGYSDVLVAAMYYSNAQTYEGKVFLFYGSSTGLSNEPVWSAEGNQPECNFGSEVASAGDVNGDGYSDVMIGAWLYDNGQTDEGKAFVYHGSASGLPATPNWTSESDQSGSLFGNSVSTAGDVNGDGYSDIIIGAPHYDNGTWREGSAFVYHGSPTGLSLSPNWTGESDQYFAIYGMSVSTAGDVNGDGYSDVIVGANYYNGNTGRAFVYYGNESGGLRANVRQFKYAVNQSISAGGLTGSSGSVRLNMFARSTFGRTKGRLVYEHRKSGLPFSGNIITNSTAYSGIGTLTGLGISGTELNQYITGLSITGEYKWRARVQYDAASNPYQKYGPWKYFYSYAPVPSGGFKARLIPPLTKQLTIYAFIQGFYDPVTDMMTRDTVSVYLRQFTAPYQIIDSAKMYLAVNGSATHTFSNPGIINNNLYYIQLKHRNSLETWNKGSVFTNSVQAFSFRNFGSAYGNNQILVDDNPLTYAIYGGDVNQDGTVDATDLGIIDNDAYLFTSGYVNTDLNGDDFVDAADLTIADNNAANFVSVIRP